MDWLQNSTLDIETLYRMVKWIYGLATGEHSGYCDSIQNGTVVIGIGYGIAQWILRHSTEGYSG
jgi:hypothetical protein